MTSRDSGKEARIIEGAREALSIARGEQPAASITINGHKYVPASELSTARRTALLEAAEVAEAHANQCRAKLNKKRSDHDLAVFESAMSEADSIAAAIRKLAGEAK